MCEFCTQHGEGKKWYLQASNYSRELLARENRLEYVGHFFRDFETSHARGIRKLESASKLRFGHALVQRMAVKQSKAVHWGQVVPIEDIDQILDLSDSIVRLPCVCRRLLTGREERHCFGIGALPEGVRENFSDITAEFEALDRDEAKRVLHAYDKQGMMHSIWTFKTPFIGSICNCDQDCLAYRVQVKTGTLQTMFRAEYVGLVDWDRCNGCQKCLLHCQFGAIGFSHTAKKATIEMRQCYGCGVCRAVCSKDAIELKPRRAFAALPW